MKTIQALFSLFLFVIFFAGCSNNDPSINATRLRIKLTDAPVMLISEFSVDIQKIEISTSDNTDSDEKWTTLDFRGGVYDVLPLSNGKSKQIIDQFFPAGVLRKIKITFGNNSKIKTDAGEKKLVLDPGIKDGVVLEVNENLYANYITGIMIDINAAHSFYESNGNYFLRPMLRVFAETFGGALKGYALPGEAMPIVRIVKEKDTLFSIPEKSDGMFLFKGLKEGEWEIAVFPASNTDYRDTLFVDTVYAGKTQELKSKILLKKIEENP